MFKSISLFLLLILFLSSYLIAEDFSIEQLKKKSEEYKQKILNLEDVCEEVFLLQYIVYDHENQITPAFLNKIFEFYQKNQATVSKPFHIFCGLILLSHFEQHPESYSREFVEKILKMGINSINSQPQMLLAYFFLLTQNKDGFLLSLQQFNNLPEFKTLSNEYYVKAFAYLEQKLHYSKREGSLFFSVIQVDTTLRDAIYLKFLHALKKTDFLGAPERAQQLNLVAHKYFQDRIDIVLSNLTLSVMEDSELKEKYTEKRKRAIAQMKSLFNDMANQELPLYYNESYIQQVIQYGELEALNSILQPSSAK